MQIKIDFQSEGQYWFHVKLNLHRNINGIELLNNNSLPATSLIVEGIYVNGSAALGGEYPARTTAYCILPRAHCPERTPNFAYYYNGSVV